MKDRYKPKTLDALLGCVVEEAGELLQAVGKSQRWGLLSVNPELPPHERESNVVWLKREMTDLRQRLTALEHALEDCEEAGNYDLDQPIAYSALLYSRDSRPS